MKHFDTIFEDAFDHAASQHKNQPAPSYVRSWRRLQNRYNRSYLLRLRVRRMRIAILMALLIIIGSFVVSLPKISDAIQPVTNIIAETRDQIVSIFSVDEPAEYIDGGNTTGSGSESRSGMKTPPPPDEK